MQNNILKIALPAGSLMEATFELFKKAGFRISVSDRSYVPVIDDLEIECALIRAQEIPRYVEHGKFDLGITGKDLIEESGAKITEISELVYSKRGFNSVRLVLAVPMASDIQTIQDLGGKTIATELVNVTRSYLEQNKINAQVEYSWGATESKPPILADAISELTDSGRSLKANNLRVIATIMESTTRVIANNESCQDAWKKQKMETIALLLKSALDAENMVGIKMNVPKDKLQQIIDTLPALRKPTVSTLSDDGWYSIESILNENEVKIIIPKIKQIGAEGIIEYALNKIIY